MAGATHIGMPKATAKKIASKVTNQNIIILIYQFMFIIIRYVQIKVNVNYTNYHY